MSRAEKIEKIQKQLKALAKKREQLEKELRAEMDGQRADRIRAHVGGKVKLVDRIYFGKAPAKEQVIQGRLGILKSVERKNATVDFGPSPKGAHEWLWTIPIGDLLLDTDRTLRDVVDPRQPVQSASNAESTTDPDAPF